MGYNEREIMKLATVFIAFILFGFSLGVPPVVDAVEVRGGQMARVEENQKINGSLFIAGDTVTVDGLVNGDVFCAGQTIEIEGVVTGDVICAGQSIRVRGRIDGNLRFAGQTIAIDGAVTRNVTVLGQTVSTSPDAVIGGELLFAGQTFMHAGTLAKSLYGAGETSDIRGSVGGDVDLYADTVRLGDGASVSGALRYTSEHEANISQSALVGGSVTRSIPETNEKEKPERTIRRPQDSWPFTTLPGIVIHVVAGLIFAALAPLYIPRVQKTMGDNPVIVGLKGAAVLIFAPAVFLSLFFTIIGIPAAILGIVLYILALSVSRVVVGMLVGKAILENFAKRQADNLYIQVLVGVPVLWFMLKAPFVGGLLTFLAILWGMGGLLLGMKSKK